jgi:hypothetical protein
MIGIVILFCNDDTLNELNIAIEIDLHRYIRSSHI